MLLPETMLLIHLSSQLANWLSLPVASQDETVVTDFVVVLLKAYF